MDVCVSLVAMNECLKLGGLFSFLILCSCTHHSDGFYMPSRAGGRVLMQQNKENKQLNKVSQKKQASTVHPSHKAKVQKLGMTISSTRQDSVYAPSAKQQQQQLDSTIGAMDLAPPQGDLFMQTPDVALPIIGTGNMSAGFEMPKSRNATPVSKPISSLRHHNYAATEERESVAPGMPPRPNSVELNGMRSPRLPHELPLKQ